MGLYDARHGFVDTWEEQGLYVLCAPQEQVEARVGKLGLGSVLVRVFIVVIKYHDQAGEESICLPHTSQVVIHHQRKPGQEFK